MLAAGRTTGDQRDRRSSGVCDIRGAALDRRTPRRRSHAGERLPALLRSHPAPHLRAASPPLL